MQLIINYAITIYVHVQLVTVECIIFLFLVFIHFFYRFPMPIYLRTHIRYYNKKKNELMKNKINVALLSNVMPLFSIPF